MWMTFINLSTFFFLTMSTTPNKNNPGQKPIAPATPAPAQPQYQSPLAGKRTTSMSYQSNTPRGNQVFLFDKSNYIWVFAGLACVLLGFILMAGGKSADPHVFNAKEVFSPMRITVAPIIILIGLGIEAYAIMKKPAAAVRGRSLNQQ
jgi:hypothetical protein